MKKKGPTKVVIGVLDKNMRISVSAYSFDIEVRHINEKTDEEYWTAKYFYSDIQSLVRGYAKYKAKDLARSKKKKENIDNLVVLVNELDDTINRVGKELEKAWSKSKLDPVEGAVDG